MFVEIRIGVVTSYGHGGLPQERSGVQLRSRSGASARRKTTKILRSQTRGREKDGRRQKVKRRCDEIVLCLFMSGRPWAGLAEEGARPEKPEGRRDLCEVISSVEMGQRKVKIGVREHSETCMGHPRPTTSSQWAVCKV